jgi:hypothetical protein
MGYDPNQIQQQFPQKAVEHFQPDKWHQLMDTVGNTIGWANVFWIFLAGVVGLAGFLVRKRLKKWIGEPIKFLAEWLNK